MVTPEAAIEAYRNQDYKRSIELYEALVASGWRRTVSRLNSITTWERLLP